MSLPRRKECQQDCAVCVCAVMDHLASVLGLREAIALGAEIERRTDFATETAVELVIEDYIGRRETELVKLRQITKPTSRGITIEEVFPVEEVVVRTHAKRGESN